MCIGNFKPVPLQPIHKRGHHSRRHKVSQDPTVFDPSLLELENRLGCYRAALHTANFGKLDELSAAVAQARELHDHGLEDTYLP